MPLFYCDARDYNVVSPILAGLKPDIIIHLAAVAHIDRAKKSPHSTFDHSLRTLENSLDIARALGCGFVFFSSSTVYGDFSAPIVDEDEPLTPHGTYGNLKLAGERMCIAYHHDHGMPLVIIRPQALYGPRCVSGRVTQIFVERAISGHHLVIHGTGRERHDFTFIDDLVYGMGLVVEKINFAKPCFHTWNLTGEAATALQDLADMVAKRYGVAINHVDSDPDKPARGTMSCRRIRADLGYRPRFDIAAGMARYMQWYESVVSIDDARRRS